MVVVVDVVVVVVVVDEGMAGGRFVTRGDVHP